MRILPSLLAAFLMTVPVKARTLTMPDDGEMALLLAYLSNTPPDFESEAQASEVVRGASEFDRAAMQTGETGRLRREYLGMADVDRVVLRIRDELGEYDAATGGFALGAFQPDRYVPAGFTRVVFDNHVDFSRWKLPVDEARKVLSKVDFTRSVRLEIAVRPFAAGVGRRSEIRSQIREVRILTADGRLLGTMSTDAPEAVVRSAGITTSATIPDDKLDVMGLTIGSDPATYAAWAKTNGLDAHGVEEPFRYDWISRYDFTAVPGGLPRRSTRPMPVEPEAFPPMPIVGVGFTCGSEIDRERLCGTVVFSADPAIADKRILSIRMSQTIVGSSPDQVLAKLGQKYGLHTDSFDVVVETLGQNFRGRQYTWGASFPLDGKRSGAETFTRKESNWQVEAVLIEPEVNRTVLLIQVIGAPKSGPLASQDVRL